MNPYPWLKAFALISLAALACSVFTTWWIPMLVTAVLDIVLAGLVAAPRR
jgi:hypothetical protein